MINNLKSLVVIFISIFTFLNVNANEQFNFDVTEIEILENGNKIIGSKKGRVTTNEGILIDADEFIYNRSSNILKAKGSVRFIDDKNNYKIFADNITYFKNKEFIITNGNSKAVYKKGVTINAEKFEFDKKTKILNANTDVVIKDINNDYEILTQNINYYKSEEKIITSGITKSYIQSKYDINSSDVYYNVNNNILSSKHETTIKDKNSKIYKLSKFNFKINEEILKGEDILIITNYGLPKSDKFYFKNAIVDLKKQKFIGKDVSVKIHKSIFDNSENDPRLEGVSSYGDNNLTVVNKGSFTSCKLNDNCPPWSISANKIVHNKSKKQLSYNNAYIKIYDIPVFYFPKFFHPDPSVERQSGFLKPEINNSNVLGSSVAVPYFKEISNNKDLTFTPTIFDKNMIMLENEFRKTEGNYDLLIDYGFVNNYESTSKNKKKNLSHLFINLDKNLNIEAFNESKLIFSLEKVTDDTYLKVFDSHITNSTARPDDLNKLNNHFKVLLNNDNLKFNAGIETYEDLQANKSDRYQYILPYYNFNTEILQNKYQGTLDFYSSGNNTLQNTNDLKSVIINDLNFNSINYFSNLGFNTRFDINLKNLNSVGKKNQNYKSSPQVEMVSLFNLDTSIPLIKDDKTYINYLTPKISFKFNPTDMKNYSDSSNKIDIGNIFFNNRLGLDDTFEAGRSLTLGLDYKKERKDELSKINKYFELKLATVLRDKEEDFINTKSTLNRKSSNLFGSVSSNISDNLNINYNFAIDNNYKNFEYNNLNASLSINNFITKFKFIEENGEMGDSNVLENEIGYRFNDENYLSFNTRRNRKLNLTEYYDLVYEYQNDCLTAGIKYKKSYYEDRDLKPTENLLFTITLFPLTTYEHDGRDLLN